MRDFNRLLDVKIYCDKNKIDTIEYFSKSEKGKDYIAYIENGILHLYSFNKFNKTLDTINLK